MLSRRALMNDRIASESGDNLALQNVKGSKMNALTVYGHSTQDGTPSPDNPVPIVSAGDDGEINVTAQGGNLVDLSVTITMPGNSTYSYDGYTATLTTVLTEEDLTDLTPANNRIYRSVFIQLGDDFAGKTVTISYDSAEIMFDMEQIIGLVYTDDSGTTIYNHLASNIESKSLTIAIPDTATNIRFRIMLIETNSFAENLTPGTYTAKINGIMLALGASKLPWMPYKLPQTLTLQTPNGLPGIPVDSGGNYTDENGQQWICDEIDLTRGKYVQRTIVRQFRDMKWLKHSNTGTADTARFYTESLQDAKMTSNPGIFLNGLCNEFESVDGNYLYNNSITAISGYYELSKKLFAKIVGVTELEDFKNKTENAYILYELETPIETDLPAEEIAAYKALHTYSPATTVSNDAEAWMKVGYREYRR